MDSHLYKLKVMDSRCLNMGNLNNRGKDSKLLTVSSPSTVLTILPNSQVNTMLCPRSNQDTVCLLSSNMECHPNNQDSMELPPRIPTSNNLPSDRKFKIKTVECMSQLVY